MCVVGFIGGETSRERLSIKKKKNKKKQRGRELDKRPRRVMKDFLLRLLSSLRSPCRWGGGGFARRSQEHSPF